MPCFEAGRTVNEIKVPHLIRLMRLRRAGLTYTACSLVINLDYQLHTTPEQVRYVCRRYGDVVPS